MLRPTFVFIGLLSLCVCYAQLSQSATSRFQFTEEARAALCPFVGTEGLRCFDSDSTKRLGRNFNTGLMKLPRGVGMTIDQNTGLIKALAVQLTYYPEGTHAWTDRFTGDMFDILKEAVVGSESRVVAAYDTDRVHIFQNASQLHTVWQRRFVDGKVRGGELARRPDMLEYSNK